MENASKALLIAGAILIVILLIAVGMMVYRGAQGSIQKAIGSMSSTEKDIHNSQFEPFVGTKVSGSNVKSLLSKMITNNSDDNNVKVTLEGIGKEPNTVMGQITTAASATYKVEATYTDGVITKINVTKNS
ncbi:MAG: hypothetical protein U0M00_01170 [Clostridia bacterium]|nr:hypothetical protein [Clostridia bacterium]